MFGWYFGRVMRKNARRDVERVIAAVPLPAQENFARNLAYAMARVEHAGKSQGLAAAIREAQAMVGSAQRDRHAALAAGANSFFHPEWAQAALTETWAGARLASFNERISMKAFRDIDSTVVGYLVGTIGADEVAAIANGKGVRR